jgi:hypothetical protein
MSDTATIRLVTNNYPSNNLNFKWTSYTLPVSDNKAKAISKLSLLFASLLALVLFLDH